MKLIKGILAVPLVITGYVMLAGGLVLGLAAVGLLALLTEIAFHSALLNIAAVVLGIVGLGKVVERVYE